MAEQTMEKKCSERAEPNVVSDTTVNVALGILSLSEDILVRILNLLTPREVALFGAVCRRFRQAAGADGLVWAPFCRSIVGTEAASSPQQWDCPTFQILYTRLLRTYGQLLGGLWHANLRPLGSLLVAFPSPPYIVGAVVASLRLAEQGVSVVPIFRVSYDPQHGAPAVTCLRGPNTFGIMLERVAQRLRAGNVPPPDDPDIPHPGELRLGYAEGSRLDALASAAAAPNVPGWEDQAGDSDFQSVDSDDQDVDVGGEVEGQEESNDNEDDDNDADADTDADAENVAQDMAPPHEDDLTSGGEDDGGPAATETHPGAYGWGCGGAQLSRFTLQCSAACRQHDVEAVCRWIPHGLLPLPERMIAPPRATAGAAAGAAGSSGGRGTEGEGSSGSAAPTALDAGDLVDLDVVTAFGERERVQRVKWTLLGMLSYPMSTPVSYRRVRFRPSPVAAGAGAAATSTTAAAAAATPGPPDAAAVANGPGALGGAASAAQPDPGPETNSSAVARGAGAVAGGEPQQLPQPSPGVSQPQPQPQPQPHPLEGIWRGTYGGHGFEMLHVQRVGLQLLEGRKLTGDDNVPAGAVSFRIYLDRPGPTAAQQRGAPFRIPPDYASRLDPISIGPAAAEGDAAGGGPGGGPAGRPRAPVALEAFAAQGQVAGSGYHAAQWIEAEAVVLGRDTFGLLWHDLRSFSAFRRVRLAVGP